VFSRWFFTIFLFLSLLWVCKTLIFLNIFELLCAIFRYWRRYHQSRAVITYRWNPLSLDIMNSWTTTILITSSSIILEIVMDAVERRWVFFKCVSHNFYVWLVSNYNPYNYKLFACQSPTVGVQAFLWPPWISVNLWPSVGGGSSTKQHLGACRNLYGRNSRPISESTT